MDSWEPGWGGLVLSMLGQCWWSEISFGVEGNVEYVVSVSDDFLWPMTMCRMTEKTGLASFLVLLCELSMQFCSTAALHKFRHPQHCFPGNRMPAGHCSAHLPH